MKVLSGLRKPEYIFRPFQVLRRLSRELTAPSEFEDVILPWGHSIRVRPREAIGSCIWRVGIYDLCVSECLSRLIDPGEIVVDIGANIGHMTSVMSWRSGNHGRILSIEPHPDLFDELRSNVLRWEALGNVPEIILHGIALGDRCGRELLYFPREFSMNRGTASLSNLYAGEPASEAYPVSMSTLDVLFPGEDDVGVLKMDVEGDELSVLRGGERLLRNRRVRDIVFEDHEISSSQVPKLLGEYGYSVFRLSKGFLGPELEDFRVQCVRVRCDAQSYLATIDPQRALNRMRSRGWWVLGRGNRLQSKR